MNTLFSYIVNMGLKRYLPLLSVGVASGAGALWAAHQGILEQWGVTYFTWPWPAQVLPSGPCILVELDTLSKAAIIGITALLPVVMRAFEHHAINPVLPTQPQPSQQPQGETK